MTYTIGARRYGDNDTNIGFILTDSRSLCFPEETLFFALKSERNDGHNYIPELYRRGVKNFVVTDVPKGYASDYPEANFLKVVNTLEALAKHVRYPQPSQLQFSDRCAFVCLADERADPGRCL